MCKVCTFLRLQLQQNDLKKFSLKVNVSQNKIFVTKFYVGGAVEKDWEIIQEFMNGITVTIQAIMKG